MTLMDVRRLLPDDKVNDFEDLRERGLVKKLEGVYKEYCFAGGRFRRTDGHREFDMGGSVPTDQAFADPNLYYLVNLGIIQKVTGQKPISEVDILNHKGYDVEEVEE